MLELLTAVDKKRSEGPLKIKGRLVFWVNEKKWHDSGAMESVQSAKVALEAKKAGRDVNEALEEWRKTQEREGGGRSRYPPKVV